MSHHNGWTSLHLAIDPRVDELPGVGDILLEQMRVGPTNIFCDACAQAEASNCDDFDGRIRAGFAQPSYALGYEQVIFSYGQRGFARVASYAISESAGSGGRPRGHQRGGTEFSLGQVGGRATRQRLGCVVR